MSDDFTKYYENYHNFYGKDGYKMQSVAETSRVRFLKHFITEKTPEGGSVLDVGCGDAFLAREMPSYKWTGIDINIDLAKGTNAIKHDLMTQPYPVEPGSFDTAMCSEVLEHVFDPEIVHREVFNALKPNGVYIVSTPNFDWIDHWFKDYGQLLYNEHWGHLKEHIRFYNYESHKYFLEKNGFKVEHHVGADAHFSDFFQEARAYLKLMVQGMGQTHLGDADIDMMIGQMFRRHNHTIMLIARKV